MDIIDMINPFYKVQLDVEQKLKFVAIGLGVGLFVGAIIWARIPGLSYQRPSSSSSRSTR